MSSCLNVYVVSLERLRQAIGSGDEGLLASILADQESDLASVDEIDDEAGFQCADVVGELIRGQITEDAPGYLYGYALEALCRQLGKTMPNISGISGASDWADSVDAALAAKQIDVRISDLMFGGNPLKGVSLPAPDDHPFIGFWPAAKIPAAARALDAADEDGLEADMLETLEQIHYWLLSAGVNPGASLVGFLV